MFDAQTKQFRPKGWPEDVVVHELLSGDIISMQREGVDMRRQLTYLATYKTNGGGKFFESPEQVDQVPARKMPGLVEIIKAVMELNMPEGDEDQPAPNPT